MRRAMALATATAAWVLVIQVASIAMSPPVVVELSTADVSQIADVSPVDDTFELTLTPTDPAVIVFPGSTVTFAITTTQDFIPRTFAATTTTRAPGTTTTTRAAATTTPTAADVTTTTAVPVTTTTTTAPAATTTTPVTTTTAVTVTGSFSATAESEFISKINGLRASVGVAGLASSAELNNYARWWAKEMADSGQISHSTGSLSSLLDPWTAIAENVGSGPSVTSVFNALVNSPTHYPNMVNPTYTSVGVGVYVDASGFIWTAHVFAG